MSNYPYAPPPPAPSTASPSPYPPYSQGPGYAHAPPRGGHTGATSGGRGHGHHQGPARSEYGSHGSHYYQQDYSSSTGPYNPPQPASYWQGTPPSSHSHPNGSSLPPSYPPSYAPQGYHPQPSQPYQAPYPTQSSRPAYGAPYGQAPSEYPPAPPQWSDQGQPFSYSSRGGRGGYSSDRSGPPRNPYPPTHHQPAPIPQPPYGYPQNTPPSFSGPPPAHYGSSTRGYGRGAHSHSNRGAHSVNNDRGEKFRHRDQKSHVPFNNQKSDLTSAKKKKRKTNTLGLTPGDEDSDDGVDEEKRLVELLGADAPGIPDGDLAKWIAERRANFPTKARVAQKKEDILLSAQVPDVNDDKEPAATQVDPVEKEADRLRKRLAKLDRKIEKRKRAPNDEGDEMRSDSSDDESDDDDKPEALSTTKSATGFLPPPPITRADPSNHCKYYSTGGICGKKGKCRFVHDPAVREAALQERTRNGGQMTLKQRLLLNDKDQDDMEVIKTIVDLRINGRLHNPQPSRVHTEKQASLPVVSSLPTTGGEANLPPNPYAHLKNADGSRYHKSKKPNNWP